MIFYHLIILAIIQGITEFLPISSSGHLILLPNVSSLNDQGRVFDVAVHFGSLIAVLIYLWRDLLKIIIGLLTFGAKYKKSAKLAFLVIIASLPLLLVGYLIQSNNLLWLRSVEVIGWTTLIFGLILYISDNFFLRIKRIEDLSFSSIVFIGIAQVFAFLPGTSRSGITITAARFLGFERQAAAKFSFLLSIPAISGATFLEGLNLFKIGSFNLTLEIIIAALLSFFISLLSIFVMMKWISHSTFTPFVIYRIGLGLVILLAVYFW